MGYRGRRKMMRRRMLRRTRHRFGVDKCRCFLVECACGCGEIMTRRHSLGRPKMYVHGHNSRGENHPMWRGGKEVSNNGYAFRHTPTHPTPLLLTEGVCCRTQTCNRGISHQRVGVHRLYRPGSSCASHQSRQA